MAKVRKKGQAFIIGALVFSLMILMVYSSYNGFFSLPSSKEPQRFFENTISEPGKIFSDALEINRSSGNVRHELYSWDRFVKSQAEEQGLEYRAIHLFVLPEKGKTVLINYQKTSQRANLTVNGDRNNITVDPLQHLSREFSDSNASITLSLEGKNFNKSFEAHNPRMLTFVEVSSAEGRWRNHVVN